MKVLLLGSGGMIGNGVHKIFEEENLDFVGTISDETQKSHFKDDHLLQFSVTENLIPKTVEIIKKVRPEFVVNCIGIIKPKDDLTTVKNLYLVNSIFPHILKMACDNFGARLIQLSTDCVFSGQRGKYQETDIPDDSTQYGQSKFLGEITQSPHLTIRTSVLGKELQTKKNLLDWFLNQQEEKVKGYSKVFWNGVSSLTLGRILSRMIRKNLQPESSIMHISGEVVSKYELLLIFKEVFNKKVVIEKDESFINDRTLVPNIKQDEYFKDLIKPIREQMRELKNYYQD